MSMKRLIAVLPSTTQHTVSDAPWVNAEIFIFFLCEVALAELA
jgi:hypothetical protein